MQGAVATQRVCRRPVVVVLGEIVRAAYSKRRSETDLARAFEAVG